MFFQLKHHLETEATNDENLVDDIQHHIEKENDAPQLQQSIVDVFDIYVQKMDQNYGHIIRENKILRIFVYPSMVALNTFMVREANKKSLTFFTASLTQHFLQSTRYFLWSASLSKSVEADEWYETTTILKFKNLCPLLKVVIKSK